MHKDILQLRKMCDTVFSLTGLDVELLNINMQQISLLTHNIYPFSLTEQLQNYYSDLSLHLGSLNDSSCYLHEWPDYSLIFLDIRVQLSEEEAYYLCVGPALSEAYSDSFVMKLIKNLGLPLSAKNSISDFYKHLPFYTSKTKNAFYLSYHLLTTLPDFNEIASLVSQNTHLSVNDASVGMIPDDTYPTKEEIELNYESERRWRTAITHGSSKEAKKAFSEMASTDFLYRTPRNPFRTVKNVLLSVNTLCRAAAIDGGASPADVHETHESYAILIENASNTMEIEKIVQKIIDSYCNLVINSHTRNYSPVVASAVRYLYNYYESPLSLQSVAKEIHCSEGHLSRIFKKETGKTLGVYLNELRIEQAIALLELHSCKITEIALNVGFSSYTRFSIEFKKYTGKSASDYLKSMEE